VIGLDEHKTCGVPVRHAAIRTRIAGSSLAHVFFVSSRHCEFLDAHDRGTIRTLREVDIAVPEQGQYTPGSEMADSHAPGRQTEICELPGSQFKIL